MNFFFPIKLKGSGSLCRKEGKQEKKPCFSIYIILHRVTPKLLYGWLLTLDSVQLDSCSHQTGANSQQNLYTACTTCYVHQDFLKHFTSFFMCMWENRLLAESTSLKSHSTVNAALFINVFDISDVPLQSNFHFFYIPAV